MESIYHDVMYYNKTFVAYAQISKRIVLFQNWIDSFFSKEVIDVLEKTFSRSIDSLKILGIGCSSGEIDHFIVTQLLTRYYKISNTVLEPTNTIRDYKQLVEEKPLTGVEWIWRQQTLGAFYQTVCETAKEIPKFHFISALAVLYYMQDWEAELMKMYNLLEGGGVLIVTVTSEDSALWRVLNRFPVLADNFNVHINSNRVKTFLRSKMIDFQVINQPCFLDITCCSTDGDEEGSLLLDFITHVKHFKSTASPKLLADVMDYLYSSECSHMEEDRILMNDSNEAIIVRKM